MNDRDKEIKSNSDTYEIYLGTFIDDAFTWYSIKKFKDPTQAYKEFKKYVNTQLKYTDEELQQVWDTGRLDIELRQGNKLLNWVGIYSREVKDLSKEEEKEAEKGEVKKKDKKDSVKDFVPELFDYESGTKFRTSYPLYELLEDNKEFEAFVFESMYNFCKGNDEEVIYHYEPDELSSIYISKKPDDEYGWIDFSY